MDQADYNKLADVFRGAAGLTKVSYNSRSAELGVIRDLVFEANKNSEKKVRVSEGLCPIEIPTNGVSAYAWTSYTGFQYEGKSCCVQFTEGLGILFNDGDDMPSGRGEPCKDYIEARQKIGAWLEKKAPEVLQSLQRSSDRELARAKVHGWRG